MKKQLSFLLLLPAIVLAQQAPTFSRDIAPLIFEKCTPCHRPGEIGPMPFTNYTEVSAFGAMIDHVVQIGYMPPWMPDRDYRHFVGERFLTTTEKQRISDWVSNGMPQGNPAETPPLPIFPVGSVLGVPDTVISMLESFSIPGNNQDLYRVFVLPTGFTTDRDIAAIEFRPGNRQIVHHALIVSDISGLGAQRATQDSGYGYTSFGGFGIPRYDQFLGGYAPGMDPQRFPDGIGYRIKANSDLLLQIHYAPTAAPETDSSFINIFYATQPITRPVQTSELLDFNLFLPANQITTRARNFQVPGHVSLISITPHSHLIGKTWEIYARTPTQDTIPIISIPNWDFNWQGYYFPENLIPLPTGTTIRAIASYDNTASNPRNPNNPPQNISWGENTTDEMFYIIAQFVDYQPGDDTISLASTVGLKGLHLPKITVYPNPVSNRMTVQRTAGPNGFQAWRIVDVKGRVVKHMQNLQPADLTLSIDWSDLASGTYLLQIDFQEGRHVQQVVRK
jgi:hypothetical protein